MAGATSGNRGGQKRSRTATGHRTQRADCRHASGVGGGRFRAANGIEAAGAGAGFRIYRRIDFERDALCVAGDRVEDSWVRAAKQGNPAASAPVGIDLWIGRSGFVSRAGCAGHHSERGRTRPELGDAVPEAAIPHPDDDSGVAGRAELVWRF